VPTPNVTGTVVAQVPTTDFPPPDTFMVVFTQFRTDPQPEEELYYLCELMARDFDRDSDHTDHTFSQTMHNMASLMWNLVALGPDGDIAQDPTEGGDQPSSHVRAPADPERRRVPPSGEPPES
jgi:hypothetical protein